MMYEVATIARIGSRLVHAQKRDYYMPTDPRSQAQGAQLPAIGESESEHTEHQVNAPDREPDIGEIC